MRYTRLLGKTLREIPQDLKAKSHALLLQAGYIRPLAQGLFSYLPLGLKVIDNIKRIIRQEMGTLSGQEVHVPFVNPYDLWVRGGRAALADKELIRFTDRSGKTLVLSATHEEAMTEMVKSSAVSYKDLPFLLFEFQVRYRDEEKTKCGLIRTREFLMNDAYSFHRSPTDLNNFFPKMFSAYERIFNRCRIHFITAESGVGYMGGDKSYEFLMPADFGDAVIIACEKCGYSANSDVAVGVKESISGNPSPIEKIPTPGCTTMEKLSTFLKMPKIRVMPTSWGSPRSPLVKGERIPLIGPANSRNSKTLKITLPTMRRGHAITMNSRRRNQIFRTIVPNAGIL